jgi:chromate reductase, NAD(P)H dehydrogenase (quinone)
VRVLAVSGSLRRDSYNTRLLRAAAEVAPEGIEVVLWDGVRDLPLYDEDLEQDDLPGAVGRLRDDWGEADAILFATPEYNGSVPGPLKNAVDWASRPRGRAPLRNKPVAVVGASIGRFGAMWAQSDLRRALGVAGARVVGDELPVPGTHERFDAHGALRDAELRDRLRLLLETLEVESDAPSAAVAA